jgi:hypothetical protein
LSCTCRTCVRRWLIRRCLRRFGLALHPFPPFLNSLPPRGGRLRRRRLTRLGTGALGDAADRRLRHIRFRGVRRFVARVSFLALFRTRLIRSCVLMRSSLIMHGPVWLHRTGVMRGAVLLRRSLMRRRRGLRLRGIRAGLSVSRVRFFRGVLVL